MDNELRGVFATRAPTRPNPIGISIVRLDTLLQDSIFLESDKKEFKFLGLIVLIYPEDKPSPNEVVLSEFNDFAASLLDVLLDVN